VFGQPTYQGDGASGIYIWGADLRVLNDGVGAPSYQRVNTATDYDSAGFPLYLKFDGVDDGLATSTITPGVDKAQVFAGANYLASSGSAMIVELSATSDANSGAFFLLAPTTAAGARWRSRGTAIAEINSAGVPEVFTNWVYTGIGDISAPLAQLRRNGAPYTSITSQGTGNYLAYPLYIGRRGGSSLPFNGRLYPLIVRFGSTLTAEQITQAENWVNGKTFAYEPGPPNSFSLDLDFVNQTYYSRVI